MHQQQQHMDTTQDVLSVNRTSSEVSIDLPIRYAIYSRMHVFMSIYVWIVERLYMARVRPYRVHRSKIHQHQPTSSRQHLVYIYICMCGSSQALGRVSSARISGVGGGMGWYRVGDAVCDASVNVQCSRSRCILFLSLSLSRYAHEQCACAWRVLCANANIDQKHTHCAYTTTESTHNAPRCARASTTQMIRDPNTVAVIVGPGLGSSTSTAQGAPTVPTTVQRTLNGGSVVLVVGRCVSAISALALALCVYLSWRNISHKSIRLSIYY